MEVISGEVNFLSFLIFHFGNQNILCNDVPD